MNIDVTESFKGGGARTRVGALAKIMGESSRERTPGFGINGRIGM